MYVLYVFLGGGFKYLDYFHPLFGEMIQFDEHIFQMSGSTTNQFFVATFQVPTSCSYRGN